MLMLMDAPELELDLSRAGHGLRNGHATANGSYL